MNTPPSLFSVGQVSLATFLGGPLGGATLMAINCLRVNDPKRARQIMLLGILGLCALLALTYVLPESVPATLFLIVQIFVVRKWYEQEQSTLYDQALANGGNQASWWSAIGLGLLCLLVSLLIVALLFRIPGLNTDGFRFY